jgi:hypothetical protein
VFHKIPLLAPCTAQQINGRSNWAGAEPVPGWWLDVGQAVPSSMPPPPPPARPPSRNKATHRGHGHGHRGTAPFISSKKSTDP